MAAVLQIMPLQRWSSAPAAVAPVPVAPCAVCMDECEDAALVSLCGGACDTRLCPGCVRDFLRGRAGENRAFCPRVTCPGPACGAYVPMERWAPHAAPGTAQHYTNAAKAMLTLQCGSCDGRHSLLPDSYAGAEFKQADEIEGLDAALVRHLGGQDRDAADEVVRVMTDHFGDRHKDEAERQRKMAEEEARRRLAAMEESANDLHEEAVKVLSTPASRRLSDAESVVSRAGKQRRYCARRLKQGGAGASVDWLRGLLETAEREHKKAVAAYQAVLASPDGETRRRGRAMMREVREIRDRVAAERRRRARGGRQRPVEDPVFVNFSLLLETVPDVERRAALMLALVRKRPVVHSRCHGRAHCFNCKTTNLHEGVSCAQYQSQNLPQEVRFCPDCVMPLLKGDGCSSIQCVCGHSFSWNNATVAEG